MTMDMNIWLVRIWTAVLRLISCVLGMRRGALPRLYHGQSIVNQMVIDRCKEMLQRPFLPTCWACFGHLQTILGLLITGGSQSPSKREHLQMADGGIVTLDWVPDGVLARADVGRLSNILLIVSSPFLGSSWDTFFTSRALASGYRPVVFNKRGYNGTPMTTKRVEPMGDPSDLIEVVDYVDHLYPFAKIFVLGLSCSGATVLNYAASIVSDAKAVGVCCLSPTSYRLFSEITPSGDITHQPYTYIMNNLYPLPIVKSADKTDRRSETTEDANCNYVSKASCGSNDPPPDDVTHVMNYWRRKQSHVNFSKLSIPTMLLHSTDDPVVKVSTDGFEATEYLLRIELDAGGHVGFFTGFYPRSWAADMAFKYFDAVSTMSRRRSSSRLANKQNSRRLST